MKKRFTPQEKKKLAYEKDHYVSCRESRHAYRKNWPKKKAALNQEHRHHAAQKLSALEKLGDLDSIEDSQMEVTSEELRKIDPRTKLFKSGVKSLREYVEGAVENRNSRARYAAEARKLITTRCNQLIATLENNPNAPEAHAFLRDVAMSGGLGWDLTLFLRWYPDLRPRLQKACLAVVNVAQKAERKRRKKEAEKKQTKALLKSIQTQATARTHAK